MALEIIECVYVVCKKIYATVDEVQANKKRCQRLAERIRCLVTPLNELLSQRNNGVIYKEALIDLVSTLEESRQFLETFTKEKSVLRKLQDACYANKVKENFEYLNDRLNILVPALTFGLQVERRKSVRNTFSVCNRLPEDTRDESRDLRDIQQLLASLGIPSFQSIRQSDLQEMTFHADSNMYTLFKAKYRMNPVIVKKPIFDITSQRKEFFLNDARNMLQFNSENVVRVFGICLDGNETYLIVQEFMQLGTLHNVLQSQQTLDDVTLLRMCVETSLGLYFLHCSDVIHRDVSSSKYLVNDDYHVKISGFEFSTTELSVAVKSPRNQFCCKMAEKLFGNEGSYSERGDVYRYGFVLCEILTCVSSNHHHETEGNPKLCREECCSALDNLKRPKDAAASIAKTCLDSNKLLRPTMEEVVRHLTSVRECKAA